LDQIEKLSAVLALPAQGAGLSLIEARLDERWANPRGRDIRMSRDHAAQHPP